MSSLKSVTVIAMGYWSSHKMKYTILLSRAFIIIAGYGASYRVAQKKVDTCVLLTLTSHKSHFFLIFDGKTYINEKVTHERVYFSVCLP